MRRFSIILAAILLASCAGAGGAGLGGGYSLVRPGERSVGDGSLLVTPTIEWNRQSTIVFNDIRQVEDWTLNGPVLDSVSFVSGLKDGKSIVRQSRKDDRQVPLFRATMTAPEVAALLETFYRTRAGSIEYKTIALAPRRFLDRDGFQLDFDHLDGDEVWRRGRAVGAVVDGRLYLILLDAVRSHYFRASAAEFELLVRSARRR